MKQIKAMLSQFTKNNNGNQAFEMMNDIDNSRDNSAGDSEELDANDG